MHSQSNNRQKMLSRRGGGGGGGGGHGGGGGGHGGGAGRGGHGGGGGHGGHGGGGHGGGGRGRHWPHNFGSGGGNQFYGDYYGYGYNWPYYASYDPYLTYPVAYYGDFDTFGNSNCTAGASPHLVVFPNTTSCLIQNDPVETFRQVNNDMRCCPGTVAQPLSTSICTIGEDGSSSSQLFVCQ